MRWALVFSWMKKGMEILFSLLAQNLKENQKGIWKTWVLPVALLPPPLPLWSSVSSSAEGRCIGHPLPLPAVMMHSPGSWGQGNCRPIWDIRVGREKEGKPHTVDQLHRGVSGRQPKSAKQQRPRRWAWVRTSSKQAWEAEALCSFPGVCSLMNLDRKILGFMFHIPLSPWIIH